MNSRPHINLEEITSGVTGVNAHLGSKSFSSRQRETTAFLQEARVNAVENCLTPANAYLLEEEDLFIYEHHPATVKCSDKAELIGLPLDRVVRTLYYGHKTTHDLYVVVLPAHGKCNLKAISAQDDQLGSNQRKKLRPAHGEELDKIGTPIGFCHPFIAPNDHNVKAIYFDALSLEKAQLNGELYDFSLGMNADRSKGQGVLINYARAYEIVISVFSTPHSEDVRVLQIPDLLDLQS